MVIIKIMGNALGLPCEQVGEYIKRYVPDTHRFGVGTLYTTKVRELALKFSSVAEAMKFWQQQSVTCPLRDDGKPNRPLTAFSVMLVPYAVSKDAKGEKGDQ